MLPGLSVACRRKQTSKISRASGEQAVHLGTQGVASCASVWLQLPQTANLQARIWELQATKTSIIGHESTSAPADCQPTGSDLGAVG